MLRSVFSSVLGFTTLMALVGQAPSIARADGHNGRTGDQTAAQAAHPAAEAAKPDVSDQGLAALEGFYQGTSLQADRPKCSVDISIRKDFFNRPTVQVTVTDFWNASDGSVQPESHSI